MALRPLRNLVLVERVLDPGQTRDAQGFTVTAGGIALPQDYKAIGSRKAVNRADHFRARVVAVGPLVTDPLIVPGAEVPILAWADDTDGTRRGMYTGIDYTKDQLFVKWPDDFGGVVMNAPSDVALGHQADASTGAHQPLAVFGSFPVGNRDPVQSSVEAKHS